MVIKRRFFLVLLVLLSIGNWGAMAEEKSLPSKSGLLVVVSENSPIEKLDAEQIRDVYLGRTVTFPGTQLEAIPLDLVDEEKRRTFYEKVVKKSLRRVNSYWARYTFTGKGKPPKKLKSDEEVLQMVGSSVKHIGYVSSDANLTGVKVIHRIDVAQ